jgi:3-(3-hydroxy-phenyl)propionate hydroxylase
VPAVARLATERRTPPLRPGLLVGRHRPAGMLLPQPEVLVGGRRCRLDDVLGPGWAGLRLDGAGQLSVRPEGGAWTPVADDGGLAAWLRAGRVSSVEIRPDRIVARGRARG